MTTRGDRRVHEGGKKKEALVTEKRGTNFLIRFAIGDGVMFVNLFHEYAETEYPETYCVALDIANKKSGKMRISTDIDGHKK